jgi:predicted ATPase
MLISESTYDPHLVESRADLFVVLTGCSGGGKSSLLAELGRRGHPLFEEPGRQIVKEQLYIGGDALPWGDVGKFVALTVSRSMHNMILAARAGRRSFFDRGIVDQLGGLEHAKLPVPDYLAEAARRFRYNATVFAVPPWPEIFRNDEERRHRFEEAQASYAPLLETYRRLGYEIVEVPKLPVGARADFVLARVSPR